MWLVVGLVVLTNTFYVSATKGTRCPRNETLDRCYSSCPPRYCGVDITVVLCAPIPPEECKPGCRCKDGYLRNGDGDCVLQKDCPTCSEPNQVYDVCPYDCPPRTCDVADDALILCEYPPQPGDEYCEPGCRCADGYVTNSEGECVTRDQCPQQCGEYEEYSQCPTYVCRPKECSDVGYPIACPDPIGPGCPEEPGCICVDGYVRDCSGQCIPMKECPSCGGDSNAVSGCGTYCGTRCADLNSTEPIICTDECNYNACDCRPGYYFDDNTEECVPPNQCSTSCPKNETLDPCYSPCPPRYCGVNIAAVSCQAIDPEDCRPGCRCQDGYLRNASGICIREEDCPVCTKQYEIYDVCDTPCPIRRCDVDDRLIRCATPPQPGDAECVEGCRCIDGYKRNASGICIPREECPKCTKPHEVYDPCPPSCPPSQSCDTIGKDYNCPYETIANSTEDSGCVGECRCEPDYYRNYLGECIYKEDCLKCTGPYEYFSCGGACDNVCRTLSEQNQTHCPIYTLVCVPMCYCYPGYARNDSKICVPIEDCPPPCGKYEEYSTCPSGVCRPKDCSEVGYPVPCPETDCSEDSACICIEGYVRDSTGQCIPMKECPSCGGDSGAVSGCGTYCGRRCSDLYNSEPAPCPEVCYYNACDCREGLYYDENTGKCVPPNECTRVCGKYEVWNTCANDGCSRRKCSELGSTVVCRDFYDCVGDCVCIDGYLRNEDGECVPEDQCNPPTCGINEVYSNCSNGGCGPWTCSDVGFPTGCVKMDQANCIPGCICQSGYVRNDTGTCIAISECENVCGDNERWEQCPDWVCEPQSCDELGFPLDCSLPEDSSTPCPGPPRCICDYNYVKDSNGNCIPKEQCPSCGGDPYAKPGCGVNCGRKCSDYNQGPVACPKICYSNACDCKDGYVYDKNQNKCVLPEDCTPVCKENEVYSTCSNSGCTPKYCSQLGQPIRCAKIRPEDCIKGCVCIEDYLWARNGTCVPKDQCDHNNGKKITSHPTPTPTASPTTRTSTACH